MEKLLFTGGTGFLGRNVRPILDQRYVVTTCGITPDDFMPVVRLMSFLKQRRKSKHFMMLIIRELFISVMH